MQHSDASSGGYAPPESPGGRETNVFGWELILDLEGCSPEKISSKESIAKYAEDLCQIIGMKPYGQAQIPYFGHSSEHTKGFSLVQFIESSCITGHFSESTATAYINVFSCKPFDPDQAAQFTASYFDAGHIHSRLLIRPERNSEETRTVAG